MTRCMALEHARDGIRVNAICPGEVRTPMMEADARRLGVRFNDYYRRLSARIPMGRAADPDEIARSILFLASDESSFMTGAALSVDGGSTAHQVAPVPPVRSTGESRAQLEERSAQPRIREPLRSGPQHAGLPSGTGRLTSRAPQPLWRPTPRTPRGRTPCLRAPSRLLPPRRGSPRYDSPASGRRRPWSQSP